MKKTKRKLILIILIILVLIIFLFQIKKDSNNPILEELIFFKLFSLGQEESPNIFQSKNQEYEFKVSYKNIDFKTIDLIDTITPNTLVREKIAPRNRRKI